MNSIECATSIAEPIGRSGSWFYFTPSTAVHAEALGLDVIGLYALGRGGVLGDVSPEQVDATFFFFKTGFVAAMYGAARAIASPEVAVPAHLAAADDFALRTFGAVPLGTIEAFNEAAESVVGSAPLGRWPLADGYRAHPLPADPVARAYRLAIVMRELRGGVHTDAVNAAGLSPVQACYLDGDARHFALHGFTDDDIPEVDDALRDRRAHAEADTTRAMAELLDPLTDAQRTALVDGAVALRAALKSPVAVASS